MTIQDLFGPIANNDNKPNAAKRGGPERTCEHCGETFHRRADSKNAARFCSRQCGYAARSNISWSKAKASAVKQLNVSYTVAKKLCRQCGERFDTRISTQVLCSDECSKADNRDRARQAYCADNDNIERKGPRPCKECGVEFSPSFGVKLRDYCSDVCRKRKIRRVHKGIRKARIRSTKIEPVNAIAVFDRDGWTCQICGVHTPRELRGTHDPNAPELDHIVPLAKGGYHTYANTQCACRYCNNRKSDSLPDAA